MSRTPRQSGDEHPTEARIQKITGILIGAAVTALIAVLLTANAQRATRAATAQPPLPPAAAAGQAAAGTENPQDEETPQDENPQDEDSTTTSPRPAGTTPPPPRTTTKPSPATAPPAAPASRPAAPAPEKCAYSTDRSTVLAQGMTGPPVRQAQCLLDTRLGHHLAVDADFGPATDQAVRQLQHCAHLAVDGKIGPATWHTLDNPPAGCRTT